MSDITNHSGAQGDMPDDDMIAAEYALGVLAEPERAATAQRIARDRAFADMVAAWERRLAPWAEAIPALAPNPQLWNRIAQALPVPARQRAGLWRNLSFWRVFALASALAAACLAVFIYFGASGGGTLIATIDGGERRYFVATVDIKRATIAVMPAGFAADASRVPELWLIPPGGKPHALGLLQANRTVTLAVPSDLVGLAVSKATLAVSLEPAGGSPTGKPTGPVIGSGTLATL